MPCTSAMCHNSIQYTWWLTTLFNVQVHWTLSSQDPPGTTMLVEQKQGFGTAKHLQNQYVLIHHFGPNMIPLCRPSPPLKWLVFDGFCCCDCFHESWFGWDGEKIQKDVEAFYDFHGFFCHQRQNWHPITLLDFRGRQSRYFFFLWKPADTLGVASRDTLNFCWKHLLTG